MDKIKIQGQLQEEGLPVTLELIDKIPSSPSASSSGSAVSSSSSSSSPPPSSSSSSPSLTPNNSSPPLPQPPRPLPLALEEPWTALPDLSKEDYLVSRQRGTIRITLNRPSKGNALTLPTIISLTDLLTTTLSPDPCIHRIIITGSGKYFCTGMDLGDADLLDDNNNNNNNKNNNNNHNNNNNNNNNQNSENGHTSSISSQKRSDALRNLFHALDTTPKTTIALINGPAFGGGVGLATTCDLRLAIPSCFFSLSEVRLGLCPATIAKYIIREWGPSLARMAMITGRRVPATILYHAGILHALAGDKNDDDDGGGGIGGGRGGGGDGGVQDLERMFREEWLPDLRFAAPRAAKLCKGLVKSAVEGADMEIVGGEVFGKMLGGDSEAKVGLHMFRKGVKGIVWEDMDIGEEKQ